MLFSKQMCAGMYPDQEAGSRDTQDITENGLDLVASDCVKLLCASHPFLILKQGSFLQQHS